MDDLIKTLETMRDPAGGLYLNPTATEHLLRWIRITDKANTETMERLKSVQDRLNFLREKPTDPK